MLARRFVCLGDQGRRSIPGSASFCPEGEKRDRADTPRQKNGEGGRTKELVVIVECKKNFSS